MATQKNSAAWLLLLLLLFTKKKTTVIAEPTEPIPNLGADFIVQVRDGGKLYAMDKNTVKSNANGVLKLDGYNTNELPFWVKVKFANSFYYVNVGDFKIL